MQVQGPLTHFNKSNKERISVDAREFVGFVAWELPPNAFYFLFEGGEMLEERFKECG